MNHFIRLLVSSVYAQPNEKVDTSLNGLSPRRGAGIGYNYFLDSEYRSDPSLLNFFRKKVLKDISYPEMQQFCRNFESLHLNVLMSGRALTWRSGEPLVDVINKEEISNLENGFVTCKAEFLKLKSYYFPLKRIGGKAFEGSFFAIVNTKAIIGKVGERSLETPLYKSTDRWLKVKARSSDHAFERMEVICGGLALLLPNSERYAFVMAKPPYGHLLEAGTFSSTPSRILPSISEELEIDAADFSWLGALDNMLAKQATFPKELQGLRFFFLAWHAQSQERFALNCMALDAIIPGKKWGMERKCKWIKDSLPVDVDAHAIEVLFKKIRSSIIHGDTASLAACPQYITFMKDYRVDPLDALSALTADCLRKTIFKDLMVEKLSLIDRDPDLAQHIERIFGSASRGVIMKSRAGMLGRLNKGHKSTWELNPNAPKKSWCERLCSWLRNKDD